MKLKCIVIDDSSLQRILMEKLIEDHPNLTMSGSFSSAFEAKEFMDDNPIDLIFLDIEMPNLNGFEFIDLLITRPQIIFITSVITHAVKAFDYEATDFLHKPVNIDRFNAAIRKAITKYLFANESAENNQHIIVKSNLQKFKIYLRQIKWIEASGDYVKIVTEDNIYTILSTMKAIEKSINSYKFIRIHKSFIVNIDKIRKYNNKYVEIDSLQIPFSRNKREALAKSMDIF